jgi:hypothetical protein
MTLWTKFKHLSQEKHKEKIYIMKPIELNLPTIHADTIQSCWWQQNQFNGHWFPKPLKTWIQTQPKEEKQRLGHQRRGTEMIWSVTPPPSA